MKQNAVMITVFGVLLLLGLFVLRESNAKMYRNHEGDARAPLELICKIKVEKETARGILIEQIRRRKSLYDKCLQAG